MAKHLKNILFAGGLGYLGGRMAKYFSDNGYSVRITTRKSENDFPGNIPVNISVRQLEYGSEGKLNKAMKGIDILIHLAGPDAHTNFEDSDILINWHVDLTNRLFKSAQKNNVKHFIYFSTIHLYGKNLHGTITEETKPIPVHPFAKAHLEAEKIINDPQKEIATTILRCSNTFGAPYFENEKCWKLVVNDLCRSAFQNGRLIINSSGQDYRNFIAVDDVARVTHQLLELNNERVAHNIYNLGSSNTVRIIDIAKRIQKELKASLDYECPIETNKTSTESNNVGSFIFSTKKMEELGFIPDYSGKEILLLLDYCRMKYHLDDN